MSILYNKNKYNLKVLNVYYKKIKINNLFLNNKFIIFINNNYFLKNLILKYKLCSLILEKKYIKSLFDIPSYYFFKNNQILCVFLNDWLKFLDIIKILENKYIFFLYKKCLSNLMDNLTFLNIYNKYNNNFIYIQLLLNKIKVKIIILLLFFLISIIKYIK